jgi:hypothetical protein
LSARWRIADPTSCFFELPWPPEVWDSPFDREKFEKLAADYKSELDAAETTEGQSSVAARDGSSWLPAAPKEAAVAKDENGVLDAVAPQAPTLTDDQDPTTD